MKRLILVAAVSVLAGPAFAQPPQHQTNSGTVVNVNITNSARVEQTAGGMAFSQVAQGGLTANIEAPRNASLVHVEPGAFVMPYVSADRGGRVLVTDPIGNVVSVGDVDVDLGQN